MKFASLVVALLLAATVAFAQPLAVPTPQQHLGYEIGSRFTPSEQVAGYFRALDAASPLVAVTQYGETYEGRPLIHAVITSAKNHERLDEIRANSAAINRPDTTSPDAARRIASDQPVIAWLAFSVHGSEASSSEAAMLLASRLLDGSEEMNAILDRCVVVVDPVQNPDGRDRYVNWYRSVRGAAPDENPQSREHREPWPGGRFNHYMNDMNRDWAWATQRETQARVVAYRSWNPQLVVDFHEMGRRSTYFFPPNAHPRNTNINEEIQKWLEIFGRANAGAFSAREWPFFVHETYDLFYPAYGDSWPSLRGAIGMTYEVGGQDAAALVVRNEDGLLLTLHDRADRHFTAAITTIRTAAAHRADLVLYNYNSLASHYKDATNSYLVLANSPNFTRSMATLQRQGILVKKLDKPLRLRVTPIETNTPETREFPAGTAVVSARQPLGALAESLLERTPELPAEFLTEQRRRLEADEGDEFYDVTSWAIPIADNLEAFSYRGEVAGPLGEWSASSPPAFAAARFAWLVSALDPAVYHAAGRLLRNGIRFSVSEENLVEAPRGSLVILRNRNPQKELDATIRTIAAETGAAFVPVDSAWTQGVSLGSSKVRYVRDPKIAILAGAPVSPTSFGTLWQILDVDVPIPHNVLESERFASVDLNRYGVLVMPDGGGYASAFTKPAVERLQSWIHGGGVVVAVQGAGAFLRRSDVSKVKTAPVDGDEEEKEAGEEVKPAEDPALKEERYNDYRIPGAAFRTQMNDRSFLTFGVTRPPSVILEGTTALLPVTHRVDNIVTVLPNDPVVSGFAWPESVERFKGSAYLVVEKYGKGRVITFAGEPDYRLFWRGTLPLFLNAVLYGPTFAAD